MTQTRLHKIEPRGLRRPDAADYIGVSPTKFDEWVDRKLMPEPARQDGVVIWDRVEIDRAIDAMFDRQEDPPSVWDDVKA